MHHESSQSWSQTIHDDPMVVTSSGDDFTNFLELDFQIFENSSGLEDVQPGLDTPMGDLGMEQLGMSGAMGDGTTGGMQHNAMASHPMSMAPTHAYHKSVGVVDAGMHTQLLHNQHDRARMMQNQNFQPQYMIPLTPHSSEMHGTAATYQHQIDTQGQVVYDRGHVSWTPLVSPAFSIPEYTVPGEYFSPLASPLLQPHRQDTYPSAPSSDTGPTGSPVDLHLDTSKAAATSNSAVKKSGRKSSISARTPARSAKQSPLTKSQNRRKPNSMNSSSTSISKVASNHDLRGKPGPFRNGPPGSSDGSGPDSVSPEPLTEILMPPPSLPRSAGRSPNIPAQSKSRRSSNEPATPSTLLMKPNKSGTQFSPRADRDVDMSAVEDSDFMLPEAATSARPTLGIDTRKVDDDDQSTPTLSAKTPKLSANSTPRHTMMSPDIQSPRTTTSHKQGDSKPSSRNSKKRQSTSSAQISPMLVPKISPSIKPLMPSSSLYSSSKFLANKLTPPPGPGVPAISADASALYLASKSNYQNILEGTHLPGVSYPEALAENLSSKRTSHKIAEQGRRNRINTALKEIEALLPPNPLANGKKERASSNDGDEGEKPGSMGQGNSKASTVELAIVYIRALQKDLADTKARLEVAEKKLAEGNSGSSQTSD